MNGYYDYPLPLAIYGYNNVFNSSSVEKMRASNRRFSHFHHSPPSHSSSSNASASSYHNLIPTTVAPGFFFRPHHHQSEFNLPSSPVWHISRYREDELPNMASNMAAAMYPRMQPGTHGSIPNRRFSVAAIPSSNSSSSSNRSGNVNGQPQNNSENQRRRISVSKYQDIPASNYLAVPTFHNYTQQQPLEYSIVEDEGFIQLHQPTPSTSTNKHRRKSTTDSSSRINPPRSHERISRDNVRDVTNRENGNDRTSREFQRPAIAERSESPASLPSRSASEERARTPDPTASAPAFEFNSSHLPLRPPSINNNKFSSGESGSNSTPESQRIDSRQMLRNNNSNTKVSNDRKTALSDRKIWSLAKPNKICSHGGLKTCKDCNIKIETTSHCSSVGPPPTFTALDNYAPVRRKSKWACSCGVALRISVVLFVVVMLFITAFIVYTEMFLSHQPPAMMDKM